MKAWQRRLVIAAIPIVVCALLFGAMMINRHYIPPLARQAYDALVPALDLFSAPEAPEAYDGWGQVLELPGKSADFRWGGGAIALTADSGPFLAAGLEPSFVEDTIGRRVLTMEILNMIGDVGKTPRARLRWVLKMAAAYDADRGEYSLRVGTPEVDYDGNLICNGLLSWSVNGDRIAFVFDAQPLIAAGVRPGEVPGWDYDAAANQFIKVFETGGLTP